MITAIRTAIADHKRKATIAAAIARLPDVMAKTRAMHARKASEASRKGWNTKRETMA